MYVCVCVCACVCVCVCEPVTVHHTAPLTSVISSTLIIRLVSYNNMTGHLMNWASGCILVLEWLLMELLINDWCNKVHGMYYPVSGMVHIIDAC